MHDIGKALLILGLILAAVGLILMFAHKIPWIGRLPGDIFIKKDGFTFYFPIATCIIVSILISVILHFFKK